MPECEGLDSLARNPEQQRKAQCIAVVVAAGPYKKDLEQRLLRDSSMQSQNHVLNCSKV
jgi:hypothetical protein